MHTSRSLIGKACPVGVIRIRYAIIIHRPDSVIRVRRQIKIHIIVSLLLEVLAKPGRNKMLCNVVQPKF